LSDLSDLSDSESEVPGSDSEDELPKSSSRTRAVPLEKRKVLVLVKLPEDVPSKIMNNILTEKLGKYGPIHPIVVNPNTHSVKVVFKKACHAREALKKLLGTIITFKTDSRKVEYVVR